MRSHVPSTLVLALLVLALGAAPAAGLGYDPVPGAVEGAVAGGGGGDGGTPVAATDDDGEGVARATASSDPVDDAGGSVGDLPVTGADLLVLLAGGAMLLGAGWALRRATRPGGAR